METVTGTRSAAIGPQREMELTFALENKRKAVVVVSAMQSKSSILARVITTDNAALDALNLSVFVTT